MAMVMMMSFLRRLLGEWTRSRTVMIHYCMEKWVGWGEVWMKTGNWMMILVLGGIVELVEDLRLRAMGTVSSERSDGRLVIAFAP
jgi:hypothetical protein